MVRVFQFAFNFMKYWMHCYIFVYAYLHSRRTFFCDNPISTTENENVFVMNIILIIFWSWIHLPLCLIPRTLFSLLIVTVESVCFALRTCVQSFFYNIRAIIYVWIIVWNYYLILYYVNVQWIYTILLKCYSIYSEQKCQI